MAGFFDSATPDESVLLSLSRPPQSDELPLIMQCPSKHRAGRVITALPESGIKVPFYLCALCLTTYRYQECTLVPGDEGHP